MATKADIEANITSMLTGNATRTTRANHEQALKTNVNSVLENTYAEQILDEQSTTNVFTLRTGINVSYIFRILKQGRRVTITGHVKNLSNQPLYYPIFADITNTEFQMVDDQYYQYPFSLASANGHVRGILTENYIKLIGALGIFERLDFTAMYYTEN